MMLRGFAEGCDSRTDVMEGCTTGESIADTTTRQDHGLRSLQLQKTREREWKGQCQSVNDNVSLYFKTGKITEEENVGVTRHRRQ